MGETKATKWKWFSVKVIFESIISGEPAADTIDKNYTNRYKNYEEPIVIVRSQSFEHAYRIHRDVSFVFSDCFLYYCFSNP